jgi:hypothetical protein
MQNLIASDFPSFGMVTSFSWLSPDVRRRGEPPELNRWRLTRDQWLPTRRRDITLVGVPECLPVPGISAEPADPATDAVDTGEQDTRPTQ